MELDLAELALVDLGGVLPRYRRDLIADCDQGVIALLAGDVEVVLKLLWLELALAGLDLNQRRPGSRPAGDPDEPIGLATLLAEQERHFDVALDRAGGGTQRSEDCLAELLDDAHHREQC